MGINKRNYNSVITLASAVLRKHGVFPLREGVGRRHRKGFNVFYILLNSYIQSCLPTYMVSLY